MCNHQFIEYVGLCERWNYCKLCDKKESEINDKPLTNYITPIANQLEKRMGFTAWTSTEKSEGLNSGAAIRWWNNPDIAELQKQINETYTQIYRDMVVFGESRIFVSNEPSENHFFGVDRTTYKDWSGYDDYSEPTAEDSRCKLENKIEDLLIKYNVSSEAHNGLFAEIFEAIDEWDAE